MATLDVKNYLLPVFLVVIALAMVILAIIPGINSIKSASERLAAEQSKLAALTTKAQVLNALDEGSTRSLLASAGTSLPTNKDIPGLLSGLERMAQSASASVEAFSIVPGKLGTSSADVAKSGPQADQSVGAGVYSVSFSMTLRGDYRALHDFLSQVNRVNRLIGVDSIDFKARSDVSLNTVATNNSAMASNLVLLLYFQPLPTTLGAIEEPVSELTASDREVIQKVGAFPDLTTAPALVPTGKVNPFTF